MAKKKIRAIAKGDNAVGKERHNLFALVIERISQAEKKVTTLKQLHFLKALFLID